MTSVIGKRAALQVECINARWREHRDDKTLFVREYLAMLDHRETVPGAGRPWPTKKRPDLKRVLVEKTRVHMYFQVSTKKQEIVILALWDGRDVRPSCDAHWAGLCRRVAK